MKTRAKKSFYTAVGLLTFALLAASASHAASITPVMTGLDSPRGLAWGPEGGLYVTEAGNGSLGGPCAPVNRGMNCYSASRSISRLWKGQQARVVTGLPSGFNPIFGDIGGAHDIAFVGLGAAYVTIGWGGSPAARAGLGDLGSLFGVLLKVEPSGRWHVVTDIAAYEQAHNPAGGPIDTNPYGILAEPGGLFITDAGGNDLLHVTANREVSLVTSFPPVPAPPPFNQSEPVPTEVERGPGGAL
jgi:hypothetical protein